MVKNQIGYKKEVELKKSFFEDFLILVGAVAEVWAISIIFSLSLSWDFVIFILLISSFQYFYDSIQEIFKIELNIGRKFSIKAIGLILFILIMIVVMIYLVVQNSTIFSLYFLLFLIVLGILYPFFLKPLTKSILGFKDFYVPIGWNLFIWFYFIYYSIPISAGIILFMIFVYLRDLVNASYCDIEDIEEDKAKGLNTLAIVWGEKKIVKFLQIFNIISILILISGYSILPSRALLLIIPILITGILISFGRRLRWRNFVVDIEYLVWLVVVLVGK